MNYSLFYPILGMFTLTFVVLFNLGFARMRAIKSGKLDVRYMKTYNASTELPENLITASRHLTNLFEMPVLFYAGAGLALVMNVTGTWVLIWAWMFVIARVFHAYIHLTSNSLRWRMRAYSLSLFALIALWVVLTMHVVSVA